jgi:hypothetical protein
MNIPMPREYQNYLIGIIILNFKKLQKSSTIIWFLNKFTENMILYKWLKCVVNWINKIKFHRTKA